MNKSGFKQKMPSNFYDVDSVDFDNPWLRYKKIGIKVKRVVWQGKDIVDMFDMEN